MNNHLQINLTNFPIIWFLNHSGVNRPRSKVYFTHCHEQSVALHNNLPNKQINIVIKCLGQVYTGTLNLPIIWFLAHPKVDIDQIPKDINITCKLNNN